jgi:two-component SAPR family response regulator
MSIMNGFELYKKIKEIDNEVEVCFIIAFEDYHEGFKESFPMLNDAKYLSGNQKQ